MPRQPQQCQLRHKATHAPGPPDLVATGRLHVQIIHTDRYDKGNTNEFTQMGPVSHSSVCTTHARNSAQQQHAFATRRTHAHAAARKHTAVCMCNCCGAGWGDVGWDSPKGGSGQHRYERVNVVVAPMHVCSQWLRCAPITDLLSDKQFCASENKIQEHLVRFILADIKRGERVGHKISRGRCLSLDDKRLLLCVTRRCCVEAPDHAPWRLHLSSTLVHLLQTVYLFAPPWLNECF